MRAPANRGTSPSPQQRSALLGDGGGNSDSGVGYGAASTSATSGIDPEDPTCAADLRSGVEKGGTDGPLGASKSDSSSEGNGDIEKKNKNDGLAKQVLGLAIPALVAMSVDPLMSAVDTAYIGRLSSELGGGEIGLGALALNTTIFSFSFYIFNFFATVPTPFVANARARGDKEGAARLVGQLLTAALGLGLTLMVLLELFGPELLGLLGATAGNEDQALLFLRTRAFSAPAVLVMSVGNGAFRGYLDTKTPLLIAVGANAVNFVLDPILIFVLGMGLQGAAISTVTAEWCGAVAFLLLLAKKEPVIRLRGLSLPSAREGWERLRTVLTSSAAVFGRTVMLQAALGTACAFAARAGSASIAAHQVASQLYMVLCFMADSLAVAAQCLVADRLGGSTIAQAREVARLILLYGIAWGIGLLVLFQFGGGLLPLIFTSDKQVLAVIAPVIMVLGLLQPLNGLVFVGDGIMHGTQDFVYECLTMAMSASCLPGYIWLHRYLGGGDTTLLDVWMALVCMQVCRSLTFTFRHFVDPRGPLSVARMKEDDLKETIGVGMEAEDGGRGSRTLLGSRDGTERVEA